VLGVKSSDSIRVEGLHKSFGDWPVLWDLDLTVRWGEFLVLFGANGSGKTTLLRILSTQARPEAGTVLVAGYHHRRQAQAIRRNIGVVGHHSFLYEDLTCRENLMFYGRLFGVKDIQQRIEPVLSTVGLSRCAEQRVRTLSHGMQKRLAIARAILHQPAILLLDEPEGGLDREAVGMLNHLLEEWTGMGRTVIMTTHNLELGLSWADRVAVLSGGKLHFQEPAEYRDAANLQQALTASSSAVAKRPLDARP
jgi:heme exporter protein A